MAHYAYLAVDLLCPTCRHLCTDMLWFQWGYCPGRAIYDDYVYHLGDSIFWWPCKDAAIISWVYFTENEEPRGANIGDPAIRDLFIQDAAQFSWEEPEQRRRCEGCGAYLEGAIMEIRDNIITQAWIYQAGEFDHRVDCVIIGPDGLLKPMPEWNDHPMASVPRL